MKILCKVFGHKMESAWSVSWNGAVCNKDLCKRCGHTNTYWSTPVVKITADYSGNYSKEPTL